MTSHPWQATFMTTIQKPDVGDALKQAALSGELRLWTEELTQIVVVACRALGWQASAKGYPIPAIPVNTSEFLSLDVTAFEPSQRQWPLPIAIMELENQGNRIPYSLWKVLCVRAQLRVVFGYSRTTEERASIIKTLESTVLPDMGLTQLVGIEGETLVVIGSRDQAEQFPYGYFKWWQLDNRAGSFSIL
ncbi:MAG: hypothetical protein O3A14_12625 [Cyanobacteria bacterium]|nr:hypothetical protein [Cyanobacteriota bacterium]